MKYQSAKPLLRAALSISAYAEMKLSCSIAENLPKKEHGNAASSSAEF